MQQQLVVVLGICLLCCYAEVLTFGAATLTLENELPRIHYQGKQHEYFVQLQKIRQTNSKGNDVMLFPTSLFTWKLRKQREDFYTINSVVAMPTTKNATFVSMQMGIHISRFPFHLALDVNATNIKWYHDATSLQLCFKMAERSRAGNLLPLKVIHHDAKVFFLGTSFSMFGKDTISNSFHQMRQEEQQQVYAAPTNPEMHQVSSYFEWYKSHEKQMFTTTFDDYGYPITCFLFDK